MQASLQERTHLVHLRDRQTGPADWSVSEEPLRQPDGGLTYIPAARIIKHRGCVSAICDPLHADTAVPLLTRQSGGVAQMVRATDS